jgi:hypothetical protein
MGMSSVAGCQLVTEAREHGRRMGQEEAGCLMSWEDVARRLEATGDAVYGAGVSESEISRAERAVGPFPEEYRLFLSRFGYLSLGSLEICGLGEGLPAYLDVVSMTLAERRDAVGFPSRGIAIRNDGGGNLIYLDCFENHSPAKIWYHDEPDGVEIVSPSFSAWVGEQLEGSSGRTGGGAED